MDSYLARRLPAALLGAALLLGVALGGLPRLPRAGAEETPAAPAPATPGAGVVQGKLSAKGGARIPARTVVYLEPSAGVDARGKAQQTRVSQKNATFAPSFVVIALGDSVLFVNDESADIDHNVYSFTKGNKFDLGIVGPGGAREVRFEAGGRVLVYCSLHKLMEMTVLVLPSRLFAEVDAEGAYAIPAVPAGAYTLRTSQASARWKDAAMPITVTAGAPLEANVELSR